MGMMRQAVAVTTAIVVAAAVTACASQSHAGPGAEAGSPAGSPSAATQVPLPSATATTGVAPTTTAAVNSADFAELKGWWRFTHLQAPGGSVPILRGMPAYMHFDSPTAAAAELGNNTTNLTVARDGRLFELTETETSAVSAAPGEDAVESYLDHLAGAATAQVTGDDLTVTGPDASIAHLVRTPQPANPATWTCCQPTAEPPPAVAPADVPTCSAHDLTGTFHVSYRSPYDDYNEVLLTTTGAAPCLLRGPVTLGYSSAGGAVTPLHRDRQEAPLDATVLSPAPLTPAQDANQTWTSAVTIPVYSASSAELTPDTPCAASEQVQVTSLHITLDVGTVNVVIPGGLTTCQNQVSIGIVTPR